MVPTIRISRQGLTRCPGCRAHIKVAAKVHETTCPFCDTNLSQAYGATENDPLTGAKRVFPVGRAMLAASLLGLPGLTGCSDTPPPPTDNGSVSDVQSDVPAALYGMPADMVQTEDIPAQPLYGEPPEDVPQVEDIVEDAGEQDFPMALYGMPADWVEPGVDAGEDVMEDAGADMVEDVTEDIVIQPLYGIPMDDVMEPEDTAEDVAEDTVEEKDILPLPLYGTPPSSDSGQ